MAFADLVADVGAGPGVGISVTSGTPPVNPGMPPAAGTFSVGGGAHFDPTGGAMSGGPSYGVPSGSGLLDLMGADFVVTGAVGDTITFTPSGILPISGVGPPLSVAGFAPMPGGAHYWTNVGPGMGLSSMDPMIGSVTVTISAIPEPSSCLFAVVLCGTACIGSRRSRLR